MKAPCCLLGAAALPRPPEHARGTSRSGRASGVPRLSYTHMLCVWWVVLVVVTRASAAGADCPVRTDARDVASKAYVAPQVVEAAVRQVDAAVPGQPYNVVVVVSKKLRPYNGHSRVKKRATLTLTFRHPLPDTDSENSAESSDSDGDCLVSAALRPRRKYLLFLSGPGERGAPSVPVAPPELANKKNRRLVRKTLCKNCVEAPRVNVLQDDSVVEKYNFTLECSVQGNPMPKVLWYKDDRLITSSRHIRIKTKTKKQRRKVRHERCSPRRRRQQEAEGRPRRRLQRRLRPRQAEDPAGRRRAAAGEGGNRRRAGRKDQRQRGAGQRRRRPPDASSSSAGQGPKKKPRPKTSRKKILVSHLMMRSVTHGDAGVYKCLAKSVVGEDSSQAMIRVVPPIDPHPSVDECPYTGYCLNGGTCMLFRIVGELVCQCAEGFKGQRCQEKEVYPTFSRNCHGPLRNIRHSHGRRYPRNQPAALWELLQQALARKHKVSPWTKTHLLNWSPTHTGSAYWPRYMHRSPYSQIRHRTAGSHNSAPPHSGPIPSANFLPQNPSSPGLHPQQETTKDPLVLDSLLPNLNPSRVTRRRRPLGHHLLTSSPLATPQPTHSHADFHQMTTPTSPVQKRVKPDVAEGQQLDIPLHSPPPQLNELSEDEHVQLTQHRTRMHHRHHHRQLSTDPRERQPRRSEDANFSKPTKSFWDQTVNEAELDWSSKVESNTPALLYLTTPHQDNEHQ